MSASWGAAFGKGLWNAWDREAQNYRDRRQKLKDEERKKQEAIAEEQRLYDLQQQRLAEQREMDNQRALAMNEALYGDAGKTAANAAFAALNSGMFGGMIPDANGMRPLAPDSNQIQGIMSEALRRSGLSPELSTGNLMNLDKQILANDALKRQAETDANNQLVRDTNQVKLDVARKELENYATDFANRQNEINSRTAANEALRKERMAGANRENAIASAIKNGSYYNRSSRTSGSGSGSDLGSGIDWNSLDDTEKDYYNQYLTAEQAMKDLQAIIDEKEKATEKAKAGGGEDFDVGNTWLKNAYNKKAAYRKQMQDIRDNLYRYQSEKKTKANTKANTSKQSQKPAAASPEQEKEILNKFGDKINTNIQGITSADKNAATNAARSQFIARIKAGDKFTEADIALGRQIGIADNVLKVLANKIRNGNYAEAIKESDKKRKKENAAAEALKSQKQRELDAVRRAAEFG